MWFVCGQGVLVWSLSANIAYALSTNPHTNNLRNIPFSWLSNVSDIVREEVLGCDVNGVSEEKGFGICLVVHLFALEEWPNSLT